MAKTLSKTGIVNNEAILAAHVTQSIDALTGVDGYDITISGSLNINNAPVTNLTASGDVDFNGNLDVDGITNLDVVDIDGAVDMASTLVVASHITASSNISASGEVSANTIVIGSTITHANDSNTKIDFTDDDLNLMVAGVTAIDITWDGTGGGDTREITFNESHEDIDVRIEGDTDTDLFFTNAGTDRVGIGTNSPSSKLQVDGDITATNITSSGNVKAGRYAETLQDVTAAGSNQGDATDLAGSSANGLFIVSGADNAKGVKLPAVANIPVGTKFTVINTVTNRTLEVYPATGDQIMPSPASDNSPATVPAGGTLVVIKRSATGYIGFFGTAPS